MPVIVIGAGAAGMLAAISAAENGKQVVLLEKNSKPGVKILMSGGTRCNITQATDRLGIVAAFGDQGPFLHSALAALGPDELVDLIEIEGVPTKKEPTGKIFPQSDRARDVRNALLNRLNRSGAQLVLGEAAKNMTSRSDGFLIETDQSSYQCGSVIVTSGGQSYPGCGTTGDGYAWAKSLGHTIVPPRPALVPLTTSPHWTNTLSGVTIADAELSLHQEASSDNATRAISRRGSLLLTHFGISGPVAMDISRFITTSPHRQRLSMTCDFLPNQSREQLTETWKQISVSDGKRPLQQSLSEMLPRRVVEQLLQEAGITIDRRFAELSRGDRDRLLTAIKAMEIPIAGNLGFKRAEVTAGGISLSEVDSKTLQSKRVPGLFFAGEVLDLDGPIGGYNFQAAFSTGWLAGQSVDLATSAAIHSGTG